MPVTTSPILPGSIGADGKVYLPSWPPLGRQSPVNAYPLTAGVDLVDKSTYSTASVTIGGLNRVTLVAVHTINASSPNTPTLSASGVTWVTAHDFFYDQVTTFRRLTVFAGIASSPVTGAISIDFGGQNQSTVLWSVVEFDGIDTTTNNGVVQTAEALVNGTTPTPTLTAPVGPCYGAFANDSNLTYTPGAGLAELHDLNAAPDAADGTLATLWTPNPDATIDATCTSTPDNAGVAIELRTFVPSAGLSVDVDPAVLTLTGVDASLGATGSAPITADVATLTLTGVDTPLAGSGSADIAADVATLALTGVDATLAGSGSASVTLDVAILTLTGVTPDLSAGGINIAVDPAILTLAGVDASLAGTGSASATADPAILVLTGVQATLAGTGSGGAVVDSAVLQLLGIIPSLSGSGGAQIAADPAILMLIGQDAVLAVATGEIEVSPAILTFVGVEPVLTAGEEPRPPAASWTAGSGRWIAVLRRREP